MTNHIHLVAVPDQPDSLARAIGRTHFRYTNYINRLHRRSGHLWQNRFFSCILDEPHTWYALRYVERNPVRARITRVPWTSPWSSAAAHVSDRDPAELLEMQRWRLMWKPDRWRDALRDRDEDTQNAPVLRSRTFSGRPLGSDSFVAKLESRVGRRLRPLPVGRPRKRGASSSSKPRTGSSQAE